MTRSADWAAWSAEDRRDHNAERARAPAGEILAEGPVASTGSAKAGKERDRTWEWLLAEAAFVGPSLDVLDDFYQTADALVHGRQLEPCVVVAVLRAYAVSLGLLPREIDWAVRTARLAS